MAVTSVAQRCEVAGCHTDAAGVLVYAWGRNAPRIEHPLCEQHSDPAFHLRPLSRPLRRTAWNWETN